MCVAVPSKIIEIRDQMATIDVRGARREVSLILLPEPAVIGEYVLVHAGFAIQKLDQEAGQETLKLFAEMAKAVEN